MENLSTEKEDLDPKIMKRISTCTKEISHLNIETLECRMSGYKKDGTKNIRFKKQLKETMNLFNTKFKFFMCFHIFILLQRVLSW